MDFETYNLDPSIMAGVHRLGYVDTTPIQAKSIPVILQGSDLIGLAQTGTGKTAAFVLPILQRLLSGKRGHMRALILSPTRELSEQICEVINDLGKETRLHCTAVYGGTNMDRQIRELRGTELVVACPGRLLDHIWRGTIDLSDVEVLVIDEADRMFDMGFLPDIRRILKCLMRPRQTMLFSATMPADIRNLVSEVLNNPVTVQIGLTKPAVTVSHALYPVNKSEKSRLLDELLRKTTMESVLVFTRTKRGADRVNRYLLNAGYRAAVLHGNLSQGRRQAALDGFRSGEYRILVATDIAARGIDVSDISHVINYDMPESTDAYIHRIGRTGRVGKTGDAFTFVTSEDTAMIHDLEQLLKMSIERRTLENFGRSLPVSNLAPVRSIRSRPASNRRPNDDKPKRFFHARSGERRSPSMGRSRNFS